MKKAVGLLCVLVVASTVYGTCNQAGCVFLTIFPGAKAVAMGGAFNSIADDWTAVYYNPAALPFIGEMQVGWMWSPWLRALAPDMQYLYGGAVVPFARWHALGVGLTYLDLGEIQAVTEEGSFVGTFRPYDYAVALSYGFRREWLGLGATMKLIHSFGVPSVILEEVLGVEGGSGTTVAFDMAALLRAPFGASASIGIQNVGFDIEYTSAGEPDELPRFLRLGVSLDMVKLFRIGLGDFGVPELPDFFSFTWAYDINKCLIGIGEEYDKGGFDAVWEDAWKSQGYEITIRPLAVLEDVPRSSPLGKPEVSFSMRWGKFKDETGHRVGGTIGFGFRFGFVEIDYADDGNIYEFSRGREENPRYSLAFKLPAPF